MAAKVSTVEHRAFVAQILGLPISVHVRGPQARGLDVESAVQRVFSRLRWVDEVFSTWKPASPISRLRRGEVELADLSGPVREVAALCAEAEQLTEGTFSAWLPQRPDGVVPSAPRLFDPTGLVKGWGVERAAQVLRELPRHTFCINAGGDLVAGHGPDVDPGLAEQPWRIGLENPADRTQILQTVELATGALATSGTAARGSHLLDPRTGLPSQHHGAVTIVGTDLTWVDVWATAVFVGDTSTRALAEADPRVHQVIDLRAR